MGLLERNIEHVVEIVVKTYRGGGGVLLGGGGGGTSYYRNNYLKPHLRVVLFLCAQWVCQP